MTDELPTPRQPDGAFSDRFGRCITYVRISITDRCNFRCVYCMPEDGIDHLSREDLLTYEEIEMLARVFAEHGVRHVRLTGGEPLVRADVPELVERLSGIDGIDRVALTTNAFLLERHLDALVDAGLDSINISLDSIRPERFEEITRIGSLERVKSGIDAAVAAGLQTKLNAVVIRGFNDDEMKDLVAFSIDRGVILRFIEFMPVGGDTVWPDGGCVPAKEMRDVVSGRWNLEPSPARHGSGPARYWQLHGPGTPSGGHPFGIISAVTECFCADCNRVRITPQGGLRACLADDREVSLRDALRRHDDPERRRAIVEDLIRSSLYGKRETHAFDIDGDAVTETAMHAIGG